MKAVVQERYGAPAEVLSCREIQTPTARDGEVLVRGDIVFIGYLIEIAYALFDGR